jgi:hypothetical protein
LPASADLARNVSLYFPDADFEEVPRVVRRALTPSKLRPAPLRTAQRVAMKLGVLEWEQAWLEPLIAARHAVLGEAATGPPRFLVRVDEFPYYTSFDQPEDLEMSRRFHEVMAGAGLVHLMSAMPQMTHQPLDPSASGNRPLGPPEIELFERMRSDGVTFAQHGTTHRTRFESPRRRSELCGLDRQQLRALLEDGRRMLLDAGVGETHVFVPPFNRFDAAQYPLLAERFEIVCGGPESVALMGFHGGPLWREGAVYLPCYHPLYADAATVLPAAERMLELAPGTWVPIVLHTSWEQRDDFVALERLARLIAPYAASWEDLLREVRRSAAAVPAGIAAAVRGRREG